MTRWHVVGCAASYVAGLWLGQYLFRDLSNAQIGQLGMASFQIGGFVLLLVSLWWRKPE